MKKLFYIKMTTKIGYLDGDDTLDIELFTYEEPEVTGGGLLTQVLSDNLPDYHVKEVRLATRIEGVSFDTGYNLGYNLGYNDAKKDDENV